MASVSFDEPRGRRPKIELSLYAPLRSTDNTPFYRKFPSNGVPNGLGSKKQQVGYWQEQVRWRMQKGQRKTLPSNWHFYYHGTGPQKDKKFREKVAGVFWVAKQGSDVAPTNLPTRKKGEQLKQPVFDFDLPAGLEIVDNGSQPTSRSNSRSQSRGGSKSRDPSQARNDNSGSKTPKKGSTNNSRSNSQERPQNQNKGKGKGKGKAGNSQDDLVAAVRQALMGLGFQPQGSSGKNGGKKSAASSGKSTPKDTRSKSPARPQSPKKQSARPEWKRVPTREENVTACFGPRDVSHNCGTQGVVTAGVEAPHFPQIAELIPSGPALFFGSRVEVKEYAAEFEVTYHYKMHVPKENPNLPIFLQQVNAYLDPTRPDNPPKVQKAKKEETQPAAANLNPAAPAFVPPVVLPDAVSQVELEMVDEVYDVDPIGDSTV